MAHLNPDERDHRWPKFSERLLTPMFQQMMDDKGVPAVNHLPSRGDVLIWNGRLLHRGSTANIKGMERRALIAHYSGINHRQEMPAAKKARNAGYYFPLETDLDLYYGAEDNR
jgi:ectoine hydroxylase-related dioxygenase (phytanoyl-CoA dioxygenase family)